MAAQVINELSSQEIQKVSGNEFAIADVIIYRGKWCSASGIFIHARTRKGLERDLVVDLEVTLQSDDIYIVILGFPGLLV